MVNSSGICTAVNRTYSFVTEYLPGTPTDPSADGVLYSNFGPVCVGPSGSTAAWRAPPYGAIVTNSLLALATTCNVYTPISASPHIAQLFYIYTTSICISGAVFTCVVTQQDGSTLELYVAAKLSANGWTAAVALSPVTWSTAPPSFALNCTTSALAVGWTINGTRVAGNGYDARSKLLNGTGPYSNILISYTLNVTAPLFGDYSCISAATFGGRSVNVSVSRELCCMQTNCIHA